MDAHVLRPAAAHGIPRPLHWSRLSVAVATLIAATGCGVPAHMRIENAGDPRYEDKDVRFRTTYYFRVFDLCTDKAAASKAPRTDTLYRFRMTGKAHSLTTQVHFESGTLTAGQIDPFGANVVYDERNRQYSFKSQAESQLDARRERGFEDLKRLLRTYSDVQAAAATASAAGSSTSQQMNEAMETLIKQRIASLAESASGSPAPATAAASATPGATPAPVAAASAAAKAEADLECRQSRRGFQILGPEGWRTFNQDERLLLAMSSSARPLISTMQEMSGRVLNSQPIEAEMLLPMVREDLRISRVERELERFNGTNPQRGPDLLRAAIKQLQDKEGDK